MSIQATFPQMCWKCVQCNHYPISSQRFQLAQTFPSYYIFFSLSFVLRPWCFSFISYSLLIPFLLPALRLRFLDSNAPRKTVLSTRIFSMWWTFLPIYNLLVMARKAKVNLLKESIHRWYFCRTYGRLWIVKWPLLLKYCCYSLFRAHFGSNVGRRVLKACAFPQKGIERVDNKVAGKRFDLR